MRMAFTSGALAALFALGSVACLAEMGVKRVSPEEAKALGIELQSKSNGPREVWILLQFRPVGKLKEFQHVSLEIREGEKLLIGYAPIREIRKNDGSIQVSFMASRSYLDKVTLSIVVGRPMDYTGYELRLKEFSELATAR